jgi:hypothetical protein
VYIRVREVNFGQSYQKGYKNFREGAWLLHRIPELAGAPRAGSSRVIDPVPLWPVRQGLVLLLLPDRLLEYNSEDAEHPQIILLREANRTGIGTFSSLTPARDGGLWIAGTGGIAKVPAPIRNLRHETEWREYALPENLPVKNLQSLHEDEEGVLTAVADSQTNQLRLVVYFDGHDWTIAATGSERIRQAWRSLDKTRWAMSTDALFEGDEGHADFAENEEVSARGYFDVAVQPGATFWLATSDGLVRYAPPLWRVPPPVRQINSPVRCLASDSGGGVWFTSGSKLYLLQGEQLKEFGFPEQISRGLQPRELLVLRNGVVVLVFEDTEANTGDVLFTLAAGSQTLAPLDWGEPRRRLRALGQLKDGRLCVQFTGTGSGPRDSELMACDGLHFEAFDESPHRNWLGDKFAYSICGAKRRFLARAPNEESPVIVKAVGSVCCCRGQEHTGRGLLVC